MTDTDTEQPLLMAQRKPVSLGRYALRRKLGAGLSGTVWAAYDPESGREVAVTLMRASGPARTRLVERARAWQRLDHPNVAKIRDVGLFLDPRDTTRRRAGVYLMRDFVPGVPLQQWLDGLPAQLDLSATDRVLALFCAAGRGLAAAHAAGLVHRDPCPASVILGHDGVARVVDFGGPDGRPLNPSDGDVVPHYPAPEVRRGAAPDPSADQYSFCAALLATLSREPDARMDRRLRQALERGMAERPEDRWPTMDELVRAIERSRSGWFRGMAAALGGKPGRAGRGKLRWR
jgi:eukaryotic-like serine/threonine-protein kinase